MWVPTTIRRFIRSVPTSTNVLQVDTDAGEGFLKAMGNPEGPHVLACELVGTLLAKWLGLPTLEHAIVEVTAEDELPFANGGHASPGPAFITRSVEGFPWGGDAATLDKLLRPEDLAKMVVFDTWVRNCDRHRPHPQPRQNRDNVFLVRETEPSVGIAVYGMDNTHAFSCGRELTTRIGHLDEIQDSTIFGYFPEFAPYVTRDRVEASSQRLNEMNAAIARTFVDCVPQAWELSEHVRDALVSFIVGRATYVGTTLVSSLWP